MMISKVPRAQVCVQLSILLFSYLALTVPLMNKAFWHDEIYNTSLYLSSFPIIQPKSQGFNWSTDCQRQIPLHPPGLSILYYIWIRCFGDSEMSLHIPVAIAGFCGIVLLYFLGSIIFDNDVGFISAIALTICSSHIIYSVQTVHAIFEMLLFLTSALCLTCLMVNKSVKLFRWLSILNVLGACVFYYYSLYLIIQTAILWFLRRDLKIKSTYFILVLILFILFIGFIKFSYDMKKYSEFQNWPKNDPSRSMENIVYLPYEFTR